MSRKFVLIAATVFALAAAGAVGASVSAYAGGSSGPTAPKPALPQAPALPAGVRPATVEPYTAATNAHCGMDVTASLTLNGDLVCDGLPDNGSNAALTVTGNSVTLNLNGHAIIWGLPNTAQTARDGIDIEGTSDTIENGFVTGSSNQFGSAGWFQGVAIVGMKDTVTKIYASLNKEGIVDNGTTDKVTTDTAYGNTDTGFIGTGNSGSSFSGDRAASNARSGFDIAGSHSTLTGNAASSNGNTGILITGTSITLSANSANYNGLDGIFVAYGIATVVDLGGNLAKGNGYSTGATPEQCVGITCG